MHQQLSRRQTCNIDSLSEQAIFYVFILKTWRLCARRLSGAGGRPLRRRRRWLTSFLPAVTSAASSSKKLAQRQPDAMKSVFSWSKQAVKRCLRWRRRPGDRKAARGIHQTTPGNVLEPPQVHSRRLLWPRLLCGAPAGLCSANTAALNIKDCFVLHLLNKFSRYGEADSSRKGGADWNQPHAFAPRWHAFRPWHPGATFDLRRPDATSSFCSPTTFWNKLEERHFSLKNKYFSIENSANGLCHWKWHHAERTEQNPVHRKVI